MTEDEFDYLLQLVLTNQRIEGMILTEDEIAIVRATLRRQHGLQICYPLTSRQIALVPMI